MSTKASHITMRDLFPEVSCINTDCGSRGDKTQLSWVSSEGTFMCQTCGTRQHGHKKPLSVVPAIK